MHTFYLLFEECTITLQDVVYQLELLIDGQYVSGCLTDFERQIEGGRPAWAWFEELLGVFPPANCIDKFTVNCTWMKETFSELSQGQMMRQLFHDKFGTRLYIHWLPYVARLEDMGWYSWWSAALSWLYQCICCVANRNVVKFVSPFQLLQSWIFWRFPGFWANGFDVFHRLLASRYLLLGYATCF
ncbi:hypothetical protein Ahy_B10g104425 [Arachis hypogaea]|uniref:Aminotransferase-like plant mobile domain-containing protein n=1 Tax=Arachis hypogaea TaxID=3818 RepID=A0A444X5F7_ARAHY|nr:hypothetical protein Ahy_B10g104425 [Arachis hypogaea]